MGAEVKYSVIAKTIEGEIRSGKFAGGRVPSEAQLVRRFKVGRKTVQRAMLELQHRGIVVRQHGRGTFLSNSARSMTGLLGLLIPDASSTAIFQSFAREIARCGQKAGYTFLFGEAAEGDADSVSGQTLRFAKEFVSRRVEGVIFRPIVYEQCADVNEEVVRMFRDAGIPVVLIDSDIAPSPRSSAFDIVGVNNITAGRRIAEHLISIGRKRIAFLENISPYVMSYNLRNRMFGLAGGIITSGGEWSKRNVLTVSADDEAGLRRKFRGAFRPDAIVCGNDMVALNLVKTLMKIGKRVPEDVAVVGFDDVDSARMATPSLTTIRQPAARIAEQAFFALRTRINDPLSGRREILLDAPLVVRGSTRVSSENEKEE